MQTDGTTTGLSGRPALRGPLPAPGGHGPFQEKHRLGAWTVEVRSEAGNRNRLEDAWRVVPDAPLGRRSVHVLAVFDGVGGEPHGQEAAWGAADALQRAVEDAGGIDDVLRRLNHIVQGTGGSTTAVVVFLDPRDPCGGGVASIGDSALYTLDDGGHLVRLTAKDSLGPMLTACLGNDAARGHVLPLQIGDDAPLLLCTDGVDGVVGTEGLEMLMQTPPGAREAALDVLFDTIREAGMPDNATLILAYRGP